MSSITVFLVALFLQSAYSQSSTIDSCQALADVLSICEVLTPSFTVLPASARANCVCGSALGTIPWGPASFDGLASSCAIAYASVNPTIAYDASELSGFCTSFPVQGPSVVPSSSPTQTSFVAGTVAQQTGNSFPTNTGGLFSVSPGSAPTTIFSVVTASPTPVPTTNAAVKLQRHVQAVYGLGLAMGGAAIGGYMMA